MHNKFVKRLLSVAMAVVMILSMSFLDGKTSVVATTMSDINALKDEAAKLAEEKSSIQSKIDAAEDEQFAILAKKSVLDEQIELTKDEIANINEQISLYEQLIDEKEIEVQEAQKREDDQLALYKERVRRMEEYGSISYLAVIFDAASFSDLLARLDFVFEVMNYDEELYHNYINAKEETQQAKAKLEETKAGLEETKAELEAKNDEFEAQRKEADEYIAELESTLEGYNALYAEADALEAEKWAEVDRLLEEYYAEQERLNGSGNGSTDSSDGNSDSGSSDGSSGGTSSGTTSTGSGQFIWPAASYYVTSRFGGRVHPIYGTWKFHYGVDIGAWYGTNVVAADGGRVISAYYDWSYGNFVMIDHGNGYVTLYAHMQELFVSAGDSVSQGEVIGLCGSTGTSTGAHVHFEVRYNGEFKDPLDYLSSYPYIIYE